MRIKVGRKFFDTEEVDDEQLTVLTQIASSRLEVVNRQLVAAETKQARTENELHALQAEQQKRAYAKERLS